MSSTKALKEKSSTPKFWKKFSLGRNKGDVHAASHRHPDEELDDDKSVKSHRLSHLLSSPKSTHSLRKKSHLQAVTTQDASLLPEPASPQPTHPQGSASFEIPKEDQAQEKYTGPETNNTRESRFQGHGPGTKLDKSPPVSDIFVPDLGLPTAQPYQNQPQEQQQPTTSKPSPSPRPRYNSNPSIPPNATSTSATTSSAIPATPSHAKTNEKLPTATASTSTTATNNTTSSHSTKVPQPTRIRKSSQIQTYTHNLNEAETIQQLRKDLEKERAIVRVLQGQKEAVTKDLDYFSQMMDDLMEEKDALQQKYEEEKERHKSHEQDLNELLDKLRSSNDNARDRYFEAEQYKEKVKALQEDAQNEQICLKNELTEHYKNRIKTLEEDAQKEQQRLQSQIAQRDHDIMRLKVDLERANQEIESLKSAYQEVMDYRKEHAAASAQDHEDVHDPAQGVSPVTNATAVDSSNVPGPITPEVDDLDTELKKLVQERERVQSDYSKIPLSGGGHNTRRRQEELEDKLFEIDSKLSRLRQTILGKTKRV
ncbi:hypothetical protein BCR43DRAFT_564526 [Syncephalastrum racemosum]|uniref:CARD domain-containing protein n=1 Tax=Syncephalastrum racemosum TaxID=13706 RepID=A0A1X2HAN7_SYNRA|nr:hypothetical protein BCR43DRAFT_564526 [Syncephalastrum racemosum]